MIFIHKPKLSCEEIEDRIEEDAKKINLMLKHHYPFSANLPEMGFKINEYAGVFELCKGGLAAKLLNIQPELNILMPCRISVYRKDGVNYVSTPDLSVQLEILGCDKVLKKDILSLYEEITSMIKNW